MIDILVGIYIFLFISTSSMALYYYYRIRQTSKEYLKAKKAINDVIISFNKELRSQEEKVKEISEKNDQKIIKILDSITKIEPKIVDLENRLKKIEESNEKIVQEQEILKRQINFARKHDAEPLKDVMLTSVATDGKSSDVTVTPPIQLRKEKALSSLTDTEIRILKLLANYGERTAVQIRDEIRLTREHTARLMKKLFISGYIERQTEKTPYTYRLKKEMEGLLSSDEL